MDFTVGGTLVWYYYICKREVWLMARQIVPDQDDENLLIGKIIGENSYGREEKEINLGNAKLDIIRTENGRVVVGEVKKSSRYVQSAENQLLFYLLQLKDIGIEAKGELLFPEERKKINVVLSNEKEAEIKAVIQDIKKIVALDKAPEAVKINFCRNCAYREFCWA